MANKNAVTATIFTIRFVITLFETLSLPIYALIFRPIRRFLRARRKKAYSQDGDPAGPYRASELSLEEPLWDSPPPSSPSGRNFKPSDTLADLWARSVLLHSDWRFMGTREFLGEEDEVQPSGKVFKKMVLGDFQWKTFEQVNREVEQISAGLRSLGVKPNDRVVILAETRPEWMEAALACFTQNFVVVTLYATLGEDAIVHGLTESEPAAIVTTAEIVGRMRKIKDRIPASVKTIIYCSTLGLKAQSDLAFGDTPVHSFERLLDIGRDYLQDPASASTLHSSRPTRDMLAVILYTSGTTGVPKGVLLTHRNFLSVIAAALHRYAHINGAKDRAVGYLPLAHVLELEFEMMCIALGVPIGYGSPLTLIDGASKLKRGVKGDLSVMRPTVLAAVPAMMDRIQKAVWERIHASPNELFKALFLWAYRHKRRRFRRGLDTPILNLLFFSKVRRVLGGEVHTILSGGAPLSQDSLEFITVCMCCYVGQGYGLTETCGVSTLPTSNDARFVPRVGAPIPCCEIRLLDWPEGGYTVNDMPDPRGEILVSGSNVTLGYYKNKKATDESFIEIEGKRWFCTGDVGVMHADGTLQIVDRKKDLLKLQGGEYVALGKVEAILTAGVRYIDFICVIGKSSRDFVVALIVPKRDTVKQLAQQMGLEFGDDQQGYEWLYKQPQVVEGVLKEVTKAGQSGGLARFEVPQRVALVPDIWAPGFMLTDAMKLKRRDIYTRYAHEIEELYENAQL